MIGIPRVASTLRIGAINFPTWMKQWFDAIIHITHLIECLRRRRFAFIHAQGVIEPELINRVRESFYATSKANLLWQYDSKLHLLYLMQPWVGHHLSHMHMANQTVQQVKSRTHAYTNIVVFQEAHGTFNSSNLLLQGATYWKQAPHRDSSASKDWYASAIIRRQLLNYEADRCSSLPRGGPSCFPCLGQLC